MTMNPLDSVSRIKKYDEAGMLKLIESFPDQCRDAKAKGYAFKPPNNFKIKYKNIVCIGLGGSAIGADLVRSYLADDLEMPLLVVRNYTLPNFVDEDTLVIASSYSGDTEEVLSAYRDARSRGSEIIVITSGGRLSKIARDDSAGIIDIPAGLPPRAALGYSFFPLLIFLSKIGMIKDQASFIDDAMRHLREMRDTRLGCNIRNKENMAKKIANKIYGKFPVIYGGQDHMDAVVARWRGQLAENSKTLASGGLFPEISHNEIVGWRNPASILEKSAVVILRDAADHPRISKRMDIIKNIFKKEAGAIIEVTSIGKELLTRIFSMVYIGDYVSFYLAILNKIDPTPVERIVYLKKELLR